MIMQIISFCIFSWLFFTFSRL